MYPDRTLITPRTNDMEVKRLRHLLSVAKIGEDHQDRVRATRSRVMVSARLRSHVSGFGDVVQSGPPWSHELAQRQSLEVLPQFLNIHSSLWVRKLCTIAPVLQENNTIPSQRQYESFDRRKALAETYNKWVHTRSFPFLTLSPQHRSHGLHRIPFLTLFAWVTLQIESTSYFEKALKS